VGGYTPISYYGTIDQNLQGLADRLSEIATMPLNEFERQLKLLFWQMHTKKIGMLETQLKTYGDQPEFWSRDVRSHINELKEAMTAHDYVIPWDLGETLDAQAVLSMSQRLVGKLAELLRHWSTIRQAARQLRTKGYPLGEQI
jgi:hypothetical protein